METHTYSERAKMLRSQYTAKYKAYTDDDLAQAIQEWMDKENGERGYLPGLAPYCNVTHFGQIIAECKKCVTPDGGCTMSNLLRNMAATEFILQMLEENKNYKKAQEAMDLIENGYEPYIMLKEFTTRICEGAWHSPIVKPQGIQ